MTNTYKNAGVDIALGDKSSYEAYNFAKKTFKEREGMIGCPVKLDGGFAGLLDFKTHYITQCCDTVGTKIEIAEKTNDFSGLGYDLLAMVADDAVCLGAEVISITNTFETKKINYDNISKMMKSLSEACQKQKIVISGGEIAEIGDLTNGTGWGADAIGIVEKDKVILGNDIKVGDHIISLQEKGFRCNGYSLVRKILKDHFGKNYQNNKLAKECVCPSIVYHSAILNLVGRYSEKRKYNIKGISHITGGGIPGNINRILNKSKVGAFLDDVFEASEHMLVIQKLGIVEDEESYKTWNMGNGMILVCDKKDSEKIIISLKNDGINAKIAGAIIKDPVIKIKSKGVFENGKMLEFKI